MRPRAPPRARSARLAQVASLRQPPLSLDAMAAYWHVWGLLQTLECDACGCSFVAAELGCCVHHPRAAVGDGLGGCARHPCCGRPALSLGLLRAAPNGCCMQDHVLSAAALAPLPSPLPDGGGGGGGGSTLSVASLLLAMRALVTGPTQRAAEAAAARRSDEDQGERGSVQEILTRELQCNTATAHSRWAGSWAEGSSAHRPPHSSGPVALHPASAAPGSTGPRGAGGSSFSACAKQAGAGGAGAPGVHAPGSGLGPPGRVVIAAHRLRAAGRLVARRRSKVPLDEPAANAANSDDDAPTQPLKNVTAGAGAGAGSGVNAAADDAASDCSDSSASSSDSDAPPAAGARRGAVGARGRALAAGASASAWRQGQPRQAAERLARAKRRPTTAPAQREQPVMSPRRAREYKLDQQRVDDQRRVERLLRALDLERAAPVGEGVPYGDALTDGGGKASRALSRGASGHGWTRDDAYLLAPKPTFLRPSAIMHVSRGSSHTNGGVVMARPGSSLSKLRVA